MEEKFYTKEQKNVLESEAKTYKSMNMPITQTTGIMILDSLGEQQNTLQNIEKILQRIEKLILSEQKNR